MKIRIDTASMIPGALRKESIINSANGTRKTMKYVVRAVIIRTTTDEINVLPSSKQSGISVRRGAESLLKMVSFCASNEGTNLAEQKRTQGSGKVNHHQHRY